ncbi:16255_t:CDS:2, partial [Entrophospora sp. SA101]
NPIWIHFNKLGQVSGFQQLHAQCECCNYEINAAVGKCVAHFKICSRTSNTFSFVLYYISHHPNVKKRMLEEIESVLKGDETRPITLEDIEKLKYCEAIIKETSRIRPTVNMIGRFGSLPDEVAGYKWPESTQFQMYIHAINNNPSHWEEPDKFNPDRFIDSQVTEKQTKNSFLMFGGGLRICPGKKIAMIEMKALLALIYRKFDVELVDMNAPLNFTSTSITICEKLNIKISHKKKNTL